MNQREPYAESAEPGQPGLRGFWSLILTQFEGAFNDNALKMVVTFVGLNMALSQGLHDALVPLTAALFSLPFILFSMAGGFLADRFSKHFSKRSQSSPTSD
jgi:acyl-[acyl-carrier-protein]-phospholipid O-acyltransferase/long-chain-fatty-acid--[acyl-carrier-protein] ligase